MSTSVVVPTFIHCTDILKGLQNQNFDFKRFNGTNSATLCRNLVRFGPATPEFMKLESV